MVFIKLVKIAQFTAEGVKTYHIFFLVIIFLCLGTFLFSYIEGWNFIDSFYFSAITLSTVGYGDIYPVTDIGKIFTVFYLMLGVGLIFAFINAITTGELMKFKRD